MSRLRARTWTPVERECMGWYRFWRGTKDGLDYARRSHWPMRCIARNTKVDSMSPSEIVDLAERIMRTKGIGVGRAMSNLDPIWDAEDFGVCREIAAGQILARHPYNTMRGIIGANRLMRCCIGMFDDWQPSDSNPNILVRREE